MELTKETSKVVASIYEIYLNRRKEGKSKTESKQFENNFYKDIKALSDWQSADISDALRELNNAHFIKRYVGGSFYIEDVLIIQMENRFKSSIVEVTKYIADLTVGIVSGLNF